MLSSFVFALAVILGLQSNVSADATFQFSHKWIKNPRVVFSGEVNQILVGVTNFGEAPQTIFHISAALANPKNMSQVLRNITGHNYEIVIQKDQEATIPFSLELSAEPMNSALVVYIHHQGTERSIRQTIAFKELVKIVDKKSLFDLESLSMYAIFVVVFAGIAYLFNFNSGKKTFSNSEKSLNTKVDSPVEPIENEWIPEHILKHEKLKAKKRSK